MASTPTTIPPCRPSEVPTITRQPSPATIPRGTVAGAPPLPVERRPPTCPVVLVAWGWPCRKPAVLPATTTKPPRAKAPSSSLTAVPPGRCREPRLEKMRRLAYLGLLPQQPTTGPLTFVAGRPTRRLLILPPIAPKPPTRATSPPHTRHPPFTMITPTIPISRIRHHNNPPMGLTETGHTPPRPNRSSGMSRLDATHGLRVQLSFLDKGMRALLRISNHGALYLPYLM